jgi:hypothetical protein
MNKTAIINKPHVIWILANESSAPYFNWFAELTAIKKNIQLSFICLTSEKPKMIEDVGQFGWNCYWIKFDHEKEKLA